MVVATLKKRTKIVFENVLKIQYFDNLNRGVLSQLNPTISSVRVLQITAVHTESLDEGE